MGVVIVTPCQMPCCRKARGERPYPETPKEAGQRIAAAALDALAARLEDRK